jgi:hypothetical protein
MAFLHKEQRQTKPFLGRIVNLFRILEKKSKRWVIDGTGAR